MTVAKFSVPPVRLAKLISAPGGMRIAAALAEANAGLAEMKDAILDDLRSILADAQDCAVRCQDAEPHLIHELYLTISRPIGTASLCGLAAVDEVLTSFATLIDMMKTDRRWEPVPVELHLQALGLLLSEVESEEAKTRSLIAGLRRLTAQFAGQPGAGRPPE